MRIEKTNNNLIGSWCGYYLVKNVRTEQIGGPFKIKCAQHLSDSIKKIE